jgi:hypothetical protein
MHHSFREYRKFLISAGVLEADLNEPEWMQEAKEHED